MQQMTIDDINGHWKSIDERCYLVINKNTLKVLLYVDHVLCIDEILRFEYLYLENVWRVSDSVVLWMIIPEEGNIFFKINDDKVEFTR